jgi:hypothetical protein
MTRGPGARRPGSIGHQVGLVRIANRLRERQRKADSSERSDSTVTVGQGRGDTNTRGHADTNHRGHGDINHRGHGDINHRGHERARRRSGQGTGWHAAYAEIRIPPRRKSRDDCSSGGRDAATRSLDSRDPALVRSVQRWPFVPTLSGAGTALCGRPHVSPCRYLRGHAHCVAELRGDAAGRDARALVHGGILE